MKSVHAYLDNAATTRVCEEAADAAYQMMREEYGNPSSLHALGSQSAKQLAAARESVAALMGAAPESVYFTSGGTESNNIALFGAANAKIRRGKRIVSTAVEHASVAATLEQLGKLGWEIVQVKPDANGNIDPAAVADAVDEQTTLVSVMAVNNETGAIHPLEQIVRQVRAKNPNTLIHTDAVQAFGKLPLKATKLDIDLISVSGHKICAPKGVGALYVKRGIHIVPHSFGGGQENAVRPGTESMPLICAFGAAATRLSGNIAENYNRIAAIRDKLRGKLEAIDGVFINSPADASPYILNISVPGYRSETMLHFLESRGVYVSSGSACSKGKASPVLTALGFSQDRLDSALRISMIFDTAEDDADHLVQSLLEGMQTVAHR